MKVFVIKVTLHLTSSLLGTAARKGICASILMLLSVVAFPAHAQSIALRAVDIEPYTSALGNTTILIYINGPQAHAFNAPLSETPTLVSDDVTKLILTLITLRIIDQGQLTLDMPLSAIIPDVIEANPFERAVTLRHLLQETAGYATPPNVLKKAVRENFVPDKKLAKFIIKQRSAGQLSSHDPVGWAALIRALETATSASMNTLIQQHVLEPLALPITHLILNHQSLSGSEMPVAISLSPSAATAIVRLLVHNQTAGKTQYLARETYAMWTSGVDAHKIHPLAPASALGINGYHREGINWFNGLNSRCASPAAFTAFPREGSALLVIKTKNTEVCAQETAQQIGIQVAQQFFPKHADPRAAQARAVKPPSELSGRYVRADTTPAWLGERLDLMSREWFSIGRYTSGSLVQTLPDGQARPFRATSSYVYEMADPFNDTGETLIFSPFKLGGYIQTDDGLYRRADILGIVNPLKRLMPWMLIILASAGIYMFISKNKAWRNMAKFSAIGALLISGGLYLELTWWPHILYESDMPWLVNVWRVALNIGIMAILTTPLFTVSFSKTENFPEGLMQPLAKVHLILISASAISLFLILVAWGVAGTFSAY